MQGADITPLYQQHCRYSQGWISKSQIPDSLQSTDQDPETEHPSGPSCGCLRAPDPKSCCHLPSRHRTPCTELCSDPQDIPGVCVTGTDSTLYSSGCPIPALGVSPCPLQSCNWQLSNLHSTPSVTRVRKRPEFHSHPEQLWTTPPASPVSSCSLICPEIPCSSHHPRPSLSTTSSLSCSDSPPQVKHLLPRKTFHSDTPKGHQTGRSHKVILTSKNTQPGLLDMDTALPPCTSQM